MITLNTDLHFGRLLDVGFEHGADGGHLLGGDHIKLSLSMLEGQNKLERFVLDSSLG